MLVLSQTHLNNYLVPHPAYPFLRVTHVQFTEDVYHIPADLFSHCDNLVSVVGHGVTTVGQHAFFRCKNLSHVELSENVHCVGMGAFEYCTSLKSIDFDIGGRVGQCAFANSGLSTIKLSAKKIQEEAFAGCSSLREVEFGENIVSIGEGAFENCVSLRHVNLPKSLVDLKFIVFRGSGIKTLDLSRCVNLSESTSIDSHGVRGVLLHPDVYNKTKQIPGRWPPIFADNAVDKLKFLRLEYWSRETYHMFSTLKPTIKTVLMIACKELPDLPMLPNFIWLQIIRIGFD